MSPLQYFPTDIQPSEKNQSLFRRWNRTISNFTTSLSRQILALIRSIWNLIAQTLSCSYRIITSIIISPSRRIHNFSRDKKLRIISPSRRIHNFLRDKKLRINLPVSDSGSVKNTTNAINFWNKTYIPKELRNEINNLCKEIRRFEIFTAEWLLLSQREKTSKKAFFKALKSIHGKTYSDSNNAICTIAIKRLSSDKAQQILMRQSKRIEPDSSSSEEAKQVVLTVLNDIIAFENKVIVLLKRHFPNLTRKERFHILQTGLISCDQQQKIDLESLIIGRSIDYCFNKAYK